MSTRFSPIIAKDLFKKAGKSDTERALDRAITGSETGAGEEPESGEATLKRTTEASDKGRPR